MQRRARQRPGQVRRRHLVGQRNRLPGPQIGEIGTAGLFRRRFQRPERRRRMGESRTFRGHRSQFAHRAVDDAARRTPGHDVGDGGRTILRQRQILADDGADLGFRAAQVGCADLHAGRAQRKCGSDATTVGNAASRDHRHPHRIGHLRDQRECARLRCDVIGQEHAAMATGFGALRDDRIDATLLQPHRFLDDGGRGDDDAAGVPHPLEQAFLRQAEMEADDLRLERLDHLAHRGVERRTRGSRDRHRRIELQLFIIRCEFATPCRLARRIRHGRRVGEEIHRYRRADLLAENVDLIARLLRRQHRAR